MATISQPSATQTEVLELHNGDRMTQAEFHRVYEKMPKSFRAELIGGIVYVASPLKRRHGAVHMALSTALFSYQAKTPGVESGDNVTVLLGGDGEPQPDLFLRILPEFGGRSQTSEDDYVQGPPEFIAEIAHSSRSIDLHAKRDDYARYGVMEYVVADLRDARLRWFDLQGGQEITIDPDGILKSRLFPGLWLSSQALMNLDHAQLMAALQQGLATAEHAGFVVKLSKVGGGDGTSKA